MSVEVQLQLLLSAALGVAADQAEDRARTYANKVTGPDQRDQYAEGVTTLNEFARKYVAELDKLVQTT